VAHPSWAKAPPRDRGTDTPPIPQSIRSSLAGRGAIVFRIHTGADGSVEKVSIVRSSYPALNELLLNHIRATWHFVAASRSADGAPSSAPDFVQVINFDFTGKQGDAVAVVENDGVASPSLELQPTSAPADAFLTASVPVPTLPDDMNGGPDAWVRHVLAASAPLFKKCTLDSGPVTGVVKTSFVIAASGKVASAALKSSTLDDPEVEACVLTTLRTLAFPKAKKRNAVVLYPVVFR
jgi:hypothetical protein